MPCFGIYFSTLHLKKIPIGTGQNTIEPTQWVLKLSRASYTSAGRPREGSFGAIGIWKLTGIIRISVSCKNFLVHSNWSFLTRLLWPRCLIHVQLMLWEQKLLWNMPIAVLVALLQVCPSEVSSASITRPWQNEAVMGETRRGIFFFSLH